MRFELTRSIIRNYSSGLPALQMFKFAMDNWRCHLGVTCLIDCQFFLQAEKVVKEDFPIKVLEMDTLYKVWCQVKKFVVKFSARTCHDYRRIQNILKNTVYNRYILFATVVVDTTCRKTDEFLACSWYSVHTLLESVLMKQMMNACPLRQWCHWSV